MRRTVVRFLFGAAAFVLPLAIAPTLAGAGRTSEDPLAQARAATVRYHNAENALADGFANLGPNPEEGPGIEFVNFARVDCTLDVTQPEALRYVPSGQGLRLVGMEYVIPFACVSEPPEDFLPGIGEWEPEPEVPVWTKLVWVWSGSSLSGNGAH
jgi:hypothetical protein